MGKSQRLVCSLLVSLKVVLLLNVLALTPAMASPQSGSDFLYQAMTKITPTVSNSYMTKMRIIKLFVENPHLANQLVLLHRRSPFRSMKLASTYADDPILVIIIARTFTTNPLLVKINRAYRVDPAKAIALAVQIVENDLREMGSLSACCKCCGGGSGNIDLVLPGSCCEGRPDMVVSGSGSCCEGRPDMVVTSGAQCCDTKTSVIEGSVGMVGSSTSVDISGVGVSGSVGLGVTKINRRPKILGRSGYVVGGAKIKSGGSSSLYKKNTLELDDTVRKDYNHNSNWNKQYGHSTKSESSFVHESGSSHTTITTKRVRRLRVIKITKRFIQNPMEAYKLTVMYKKNPTRCIQVCKQIEPQDPMLVVGVAAKIVANPSFVSQARESYSADPIGAVLRACEVVDGDEEATYRSGDDDDDDDEDYSDSETRDLLSYAKTQGVSASMHLQVTKSVRYYRRIMILRRFVQNPPEAIFIVKLYRKDPARCIQQAKMISEDPVQVIRVATKFVANAQLVKESQSYSTDPWGTVFRAAELLDEDNQQSRDTLDEDDDDDDEDSPLAGEATEDQDGVDEDQLDNGNDNYSMATQGSYKSTYKYQRKASYQRKIQVIRRFVKNPSEAIILAGVYKKNPSSSIKLAATILPEDPLLVLGVATKFESNPTLAVGIAKSYSVNPAGAIMRAAQLVDGDDTVDEEQKARVSQDADEDEFSTASRSAGMSYQSTYQYQQTSTRKTRVLRWFVQYPDQAVRLTATLKTNPNLCIQLAKEILPEDPMLVLRIATRFSYQQSSVMSLSKLYVVDPVGAVKRAAELIDDNVPMDEQFQAIYQSDYQKETSSKYEIRIVKRFVANPTEAIHIAALYKKDYNQCIEAASIIYREDPVMVIRIATQFASHQSSLTSICKSYVVNPVGALMRAAKLIDVPVNEQQMRDALQDDDDDNNKEQQGTFRSFAAATYQHQYQKKTTVKTRIIRRFVENPIEASQIASLYKVNYNQCVKVASTIYREDPVMVIRIATQFASHQSSFKKISELYTVNPTVALNRAVQLADGVKSQDEEQLEDGLQEDDDDDYDDDEEEEQGPFESARRKRSVQQEANEDESPAASRSTGMSYQSTYQYQRTYKRKIRVIRWFVQYPNQAVQLTITYRTNPDQGIKVASRILPEDPMLVIRMATQFESHQSSILRLSKLYRVDPVEAVTRAAELIDGDLPMDEEEMKDALEEADANEYKSHLRSAGALYQYQYNSKTTYKHKIRIIRRFLVNPMEAIQLATLHKTNLNQCMTLASAIYEEDPVLVIRMAIHFASHQTSLMSTSKSYVVDPVGALTRAAELIDGDDAINEEQMRDALQEMDEEEQPEAFRSSSAIYQYQYQRKTTVKIRIIRRFVANPTEAIQIAALYKTDYTQCIKVASAIYRKDPVMVIRIASQFASHQSSLMSLSKSYVVDPVAALMRAAHLVDDDDTIDEEQMRDALQEIDEEDQPGAFRSSSAIYQYQYQSKTTVKIRIIRRFVANPIEASQIAALYKTDYNQCIKVASTIYRKDPVMVIQIATQFASHQSSFTKISKLYTVNPVGALMRAAQLADGVNSIDEEQMRDALQEIDEGGEPGASRSSSAIYQYQCQKGTTGKIRIIRRFVANPMEAIQIAALYNKDYTKCIKIASTICREDPVTVIRIAIQFASHQSSLMNISKSYVVNPVKALRRAFQLVDDDDAITEEEMRDALQELDFKEEQPGAHRSSSAIYQQQYQKKTTFRRKIKIIKRFIINPTEVIQLTDLQKTNPVQGFQLASSISPEDPILAAQIATKLASNLTLVGDISKSYSVNPTVAVMRATQLVDGDNPLNEQEMRDALQEVDEEEDQEAFRSAQQTQVALQEVDEEERQEAPRSDQSTPQGSYQYQQTSTYNRKIKIIRRFVQDPNEANQLATIFRTDPKRCVQLAREILQEDPMLVIQIATKFASNSALVAEIFKSYSVDPVRAVLRAAQLVEGDTPIDEQSFRAAFIEEDGLIATDNKFGFRSLVEQVNDSDSDIEKNNDSENKESSIIRSTEDLVKLAQKNPELQSASEPTDLKKNEEVGLGSSISLRAAVDELVNKSVDDAKDNIRSSEDLVRLADAITGPNSVAVSANNGDGLKPNDTEGMFRSALEFADLNADDSEVVSAAKNYAEPPMGAFRSALEFADFNSDNSETGSASKDFANPPSGTFRSALELADVDGGDSSLAHTSNGFKQIPESTFRSAFEFADFDGYNSRPDSRPKVANQNTYKGTLRVALGGNVSTDGMGFLNASQTSSQTSLQPNGTTTENNDDDTEDAFQILSAFSKRSGIDEDAGLASKTLEHHKRPFVKLRDVARLTRRPSLLYKFKLLRQFTEHPTRAMQLVAANRKNPRLGLAVATRFSEDPVQAINIADTLASDPTVALDLGRMYKTDPYAAIERAATLVANKEDKPFDSMSVKSVIFEALEDVKEENQQHTDVPGEQQSTNDNTIDLTSSLRTDRTPILPD